MLSSDFDPLKIEKSRGQLQASFSRPICSDTEPVLYWAEHFSKSDWSDRTRICKKVFLGSDLTVAAIDLAYAYKAQGEGHFFTCMENVNSSSQDWRFFINFTHFRTVHVKIYNKTKHICRVDEKYATNPKSKIFLMAFRFSSKKLLTLELKKGCK